MEALAWPPRGKATKAANINFTGVPFMFAAREAQLKVGRSGLLATDHAENDEPSSFDKLGLQSDTNGAGLNCKIFARQISGVRTETFAASTCQRFLMQVLLGSAVSTQKTTFRADAALPINGRPFIASGD